MKKIPHNSEVIEQEMFTIFDDIIVFFTTQKHSEWWLSTYHERIRRYYIIHFKVNSYIM